jgi:hypothetical protein
MRLTESVSSAASAKVPQARVLRSRREAHRTASPGMSRSWPETFWKMAWKAEGFGDWMAMDRIPHAALRWSTTMALANREKAMMEK